MADRARSDLRKGVRALHRRVRLANVRLQRVVAETVADPPFVVASVSVSAQPPEIWFGESEFACRLTYRVGLLDDERWDLGAAEATLVLEYDVDAPMPPTEVLAAYVDVHAGAVALPYLRETIHTLTGRLGIAVVLGLLNDDDVLPTEVRLVSGATRDP
jgi:hypothetical protein